VLLPWLLAVGSVVLGLYVWPRPAPEADLSNPPAADEPKDVKALRLALAASSAENQALRQELDRTLGVLAVNRPRPAASNAEDGARQHEIAKRLQDALSRLSSGGEAARVEVSKAVLEALNLKAGAFATLREAYLNTTDPEGRKLLIGPMCLSRAPEVGDFLAEQALEEKDPGLRRELIAQASNYATPDIANGLQSAFIESLGASDDADLRKAAIRGLRYARGEGVGDALLRAASDPDEGVRLAAIDALSSRSELRQQLTEVLSRDASPRVREIGNCHLLIAQETRKPRRRR
jgi:hypothetical protein